MRQIRMNTFETNSSSVHSLVMCSEEEYKALKSGKLLINVYNNTLKAADSIDIFSEEDIKKYYNDTKEMFWKDYELLSDEEKAEVRTRYEKKYSRRHDYETYDEHMDDYDLETFFDSYTTSGGEKIIAFGKYGYDG